MTTVEAGGLLPVVRLRNIDLERAKTAITYEVPGLDLSGLGHGDEIPLDLSRTGGDRRGEPR